MEDMDGQELEEKRKAQRQGDMAAGISAGVGAAMGVVGGSFIAGKANAAGMADEEEADDVSDAGAPAEGAASSGGATVHGTASAPSQASSTSSSESAAQPIEVAPASAAEPSDVTASSSAGPDIQVLDYGTAYDGQGNTAEVAVLSVDGHQGAVLDIDMDGEADVVAVDFNDNGDLDAGEAAYVSDEHILMAPIRDAAEGNGPWSDASDDMSQDDGPDYINDADVDVYMA